MSNNKVFLHFSEDSDSNPKTGSAKTAKRSRVRKQAKVGAKTTIKDYLTAPTPVGRHLPVGRPIPVGKHLPRRALRTSG